MKQKKIKVYKDYKFSYNHTHKEKLSDKLVVMLHGFCMDKDEKGNYVKLADILLDNGYDSIRLDFLGHGETNGDSIELTIGLCLKEIDLIVSDYNYKNISIIGTSFGGGIGVLYSDIRNIDKLVLISPLIDYQRNVIKPENHFCREFLGEEALKNIREKGYSTFGMTDYKFDERLYEDVKKYNPVDVIKNTNSKILIIHGDKDLLVPYKQSVDISNLNDNISLDLIANGSHCFYDEYDIIIEKTLLFLKQ